MALRKREKRFLLFAALAVAVLVFDQLCYTPQSRKIARLKEELRAVEGKAEELQMLARTAEGLESEINRLEAMVREFENRTLRLEGLNGFLRHLGEESHRLQMKIVSLNPEKVPSQGGSEKTEPRPYKRVRLRAVLHSRFDSLWEYLKGIEHLPFLVRVTELQVEREEKIHPLLRVTLILTVYLLSEDGKEAR